MYLGLKLKNKIIIITCHARQVYNNLILELIIIIIIIIIIINIIQCAG